MPEPAADNTAVKPFWPAWTRTLDAMIAGMATARSRCRRCHILLHVDLGALRQRLGGSATLIDRADACAVVGCGGTIYYVAAPATGAAYYVLVGEPDLFDGVIDPVDLPFRSRWHGMVPVGPAPLPSPYLAAVIALHGCHGGQRVSGAEAHGRMEER